MRWIVLWTKIMFSLLFTKSITDLVEWLNKKKKIQTKLITLLSVIIGIGILNSSVNNQLNHQNKNTLTHLLHACTSVSKANSRSVSNLWCIGDHLNSGMRNMVVRGPGLNCRRCSSVMGMPLKPRSTRRSRSSWAAVRPWRAWKVDRPKCLSATRRLPVHLTT